MALSAGEQLGPYRIIAPIGKGGMGEVYRATDTRMGRDVAVKVVAERFSERFTREVRAIAALNHPNICTIHDVGPNYLVMEYLDGSPVRGPLPEPKAIELARQIAAALEAAHAKGVIHRDLKPANILVTRDGVKLLDFGLATLGRHEEGVSTSPAWASQERTPGESTPIAVGDDDLQTVPFLASTRAGDVLGTPAYMSPEQASGAPVDAESDIFSFGVTLYEMLTGRRPFAATTEHELMAAIRHAEPDALEVAPEVGQVVARCLRKTPAERYRSVMELRLALDKAAAALSKRAPSVAVLPFESAQPEHEYFGDGLAADIINALSRVGGLRVIARTSTLAFKHHAQDVRSIAKTLGVDHILEGSVRTAGNRIRITAQLITAEDGTQLWSKRYDRDLTDVFEIQDEISNAIAMELKVSLTSRPLVKPPTMHFAAYEAVLQGRHHFFRFDPQGQAQAFAAFEKAVTIDPGYADAHVGLAMYHWGQMVIGMADPRETMARSVVSARQAMRLDPANSEAHHILGSYFAAHDFDWAEADRYFRRAIELNESSLYAYHCYVMYCLAPLGRLEEALATEDLALSKDPLELGMLVVRSLILEGLGRQAAEVQSIERVCQLDPDFAFGQFQLVRLRARQRRFDEAISLAERAAAGGRWGITLGGLGIAHGAAGHTAIANDLIAELQASPMCAQSHAFYTALITAAQGDASAAFDWAARSLERRDHLIGLFLRTSSFDLLRANGSFERLLRMMNVG